MEYLRSVDRFSEELASLGNVCYIGDFLLSAVVAFLAFEILYLIKLGKDASLLDQIEKISQHPIAFRRTLRWVKFRYAILAGLMAIAAIGIQHGCGNWKAAVIYGFLGPFLVSNVISEKWKGDIQREGGSIVVKYGPEQIQDTLREKDAAQESARRDILADLMKRIRSAQEEPNNGK